MKIAKITLDGYFNYGNVLQNYALFSVLSRFGEVDALWHSPDNFMVNVWYKWSWKDKIKFVLNWRGFKERILSAYHGMEIVRQGKIKEWCDRYIHIKKESTNLDEIADKYDYFVVGSDQVWNPYLSDLECCFLSFAPKNKRVAYAASISCTEIPADKYLKYKEGLSGMAKISMREQAGADMVKNLSGRDVSVVVDPTLLLESDEWRAVSRQPAWYHGEKYILTYFLGEKPKIVDKLTRKMGLLVVNLLDKDVYEYYVTGPDEFIWAIEHASLVLTDSFHGTVFSIIFHTPFIVYDRVGSAIAEKMGSRIDTLLDCFKLKNRRGIIEYSSSLVEQDWSYVDEKLVREKKRSLLYLQDALK